MNNIEAKNRIPNRVSLRLFLQSPDILYSFTFSIAPTKPFLDLHIFCSLPSFGEGPVISQTHYID
jgi:hypothetical protein